MIRTVLLTLYFSALFRAEDSLVAFDCLHDEARITTMSLLSPPECNKIEHQRDLTKTVRGQLLQNKKTMSVHYIQCKIERLIKIHRCEGLYSYTYDVTESRFEDFIIPTESECKDLHRTLSIKLTPTETLSGLYKNSTVTGQAFLAGYVASNGWCQGGSWGYNGKRWDKAVVKAYYKVTLHDGYANVLVETNKVILPGGLMCDYDQHDTTCIHISHGSTFWEQPNQSCEDKNWIVLYTGEMQSMPTKEPNQSLFTHSSQTISFAIETTGYTYVCGRRVLKTPHITLMILIETPESPLIVQHDSFHPGNVDFALYVNTKFIYFDQGIQRQFETIYDLFASHQCEIDRRTISNLQTLAYLSGPEFAYAFKKTPGYTAEIRGEVAHIISCVPVPVQLRQVKGCFKELPVLYRNQSWFLSPRNRILTRYGTETDCSPMLNVMYNLGSNWYSIYPQPLISKPPHDIENIKFPNFTYISPKGLATSGIYSTEKIREYQSKLLLGNEMDAIISVVARGFTGRIPMLRQGSILSLMNDLDIKDLSDNLGRKMWSWIQDLITFGAAVFGFLFIWNGIIKLLNACASAYALYEVFGWTWKLILCWWTSLVHFLLYKNISPRSDNKCKEDVEAQRETLQDEYKSLNPSSSAPLYPALSEEMKAAYPQQYK